MKTILFVSPTGTFDNGAEISIYHLMVFLKDQGYKVINVAPVSTINDQKGYESRFTASGIKVYFTSSIKWWWKDAPGGMVGTPAQRASSYRDSISYISGIIDHEQVDLVITNTVNMFQGAVAAGIKKVPHYQLIHEFPDGEFSYYLDKIDFIEEASDEVFSVAGELNKVLKERFTGKDVRQFTPFTEIHSSELNMGKQRRIVSVGRISMRKNQLELIKAFEKLSHKKAFSDVSLLLVGPWDEDYKKICDDYISTNQVKKIEFTGNLDDPWSVVTDQDLCVFPSSLETYGLVYVEALLNGVPAILSDNPGHSSAHSLFEFGEMYHLGDVDELSNKIESVIKDFENRKIAAESFKVKAADIYKVENVYSEIVQAIKAENEGNLKPFRHLGELLMLNESKSKLARLETKIRINLQRVTRKLKR